jgi:hypothetical protein
MTIDQRAFTFGKQNKKPPVRFGGHKKNFLSMLDIEIALTHYLIMPIIERFERREKARKSATPILSPDTHLKLKRVRRGETPTSARKSAKKSAKPKIKRYFQYYRNGKYYFIDLDLKKKGHQQKFI